MEQSAVEQPPALSFSGVGFAYAGRSVVNEADWTVQRGTRTALVGPNGVGKSTLLKLASGLVAATGGTLHLFGKDVRSLTPRESARLIAVVHQHENVVFPYPVHAMVMHGRFPYATGFGFEREEDHKAVARALELTGVAPLAHRSITEMSGGELHRVFIARAIAQDTPLIFLDEPNAFLDIKNQVALFELLVELNERHGKTVVCITHDLNLAAMYFDTIAIMHEGRIAFSGPPAEALQADLIKRHFDVDVTVDSEGEGGIPYIRLRRTAF